MITSLDKLANPRAMEKINPIECIPIASHTPTHYINIGRNAVRDCATYSGHFSIPRHKGLSSEGRSFFLALQAGSANIATVGVGACCWMPGQGSYLPIRWAVGDSGMTADGSEDGGSIRRISSVPWSLFLLNTGSFHRVAATSSETLALVGVWGLSPGKVANIVTQYPFSKDSILCGRGQRKGSGFKMSRSEFSLGHRCLWQRLVQSYLIVSLFDKLDCSGR